MIRLDDVRTQLEAQVGELQGRTGNAREFSNLVESGQLPQTTPHAFVIFSGMQGGQADAVSGLFLQSYSETTSVVLMVRTANDPLGDRAIDEITPIVRAVIKALAGWAPEDAIGVFQLARAELVGARTGVLVFQIDFTLNDQLRIPR